MENATTSGNEDSSVLIIRRLGYKAIGSGSTPLLSVFRFLKGKALRAANDEDVTISSPYRRHFLGRINIASEYSPSPLLSLSPLPLSWPIKLPLIWESQLYIASGVLNIIAKDSIRQLFCPNGGNPVF